MAEETTSFSVAADLPEKVSLGVALHSHENTPLSENPPPKVHVIQGWKRALIWPIGLLVRLWTRSLRIEGTPEAVSNFSWHEQPVVIMLWHNRLFLASEVVRRFRQHRPTYSLVSASKDGAWLDVFFSMVRMKTVRGSSHQLGREAVMALIEMLKSGFDVGITPDGPRGPLYDFKAGGVVVARRARAPVLLLGLVFESAWRLKSWDRFYLPRPFSRVTLKCEYVPFDPTADRDAMAEALRLRLAALNPDEPECTTGSV